MPADGGRTCTMVQLNSIHVINTSLWQTLLKRSLNFSQFVAHKHWLRSCTSPRRFRAHPAKRGGLIKASGKRNKKVVVKHSVEGVRKRLLPWQGWGVVPI